MTFSEAHKFLSRTHIDTTKAVTWADLGCGNGLFTKVLTSRLPAGSVVYAIDKSHLLSDVSLNPEVAVLGQKVDFEEELALGKLNGILMANSLHYVKDKEAFLRKLKRYLLPNSEFIIIEYDLTKANRWVPYPVPFYTLKDLFPQIGFGSIEKTAERTSVYQSGVMYAALIRQ